MYIFLKRLLQLCILFLLVLVIAVIVLVVFVKPDRLKPVLINKVKALTGQTLVMDGDLSWTVFPVLGVHTGHLALSGPAGFSDQHIIEIQQVRLGVRIFPLLYGRIETNQILLQGMRIHLQKNASGQTNWSFLIKKSPHPSSIPAAPVSGRETGAKQQWVLPVMAGIDIQDASISWVDDMQHQSVRLQDISMHTGKTRAADSPFPLKMAMKYSVMPQGVQGSVTLSARVIPDLKAQTLTFKNLDVHESILRKGGEVPVTSQGILTVDFLQGTLTLEKLAGNLAGAPFTGSLHVRDLQAVPVMTGSLAFQPFDLYRMLDKMQVNAWPLEAGKNVRGQVEFSLKGNRLADATADGMLQADDLRVARILLTDVQTTLRLHGGILDILPVKAKLYQGDAFAEARIHLAKALQTSLKLTLQGIEAQPLLQDLGAGKGRLSVSGKGDLSLLVSTVGTTSQEMTRSLNGIMHFSLANGAVNGLNLYYMLDSAAALVKRQAPAPQPAGEGNRTPFGILSGSFMIRNGVMTSHDLQLAGPRLAATGGGDIDLPAAKIDLALRLNIQKTDAAARDNLRNLYGIPIAVQVTGDLTHPVPRLDAGAIAAAIAQKELQKAVTDHVNGHINEQAGELLKHLLGR